MKFLIILFSVCFFVVTYIVAGRIAATEEKLEVMEKQYNEKIDTEIETLQNTQDQWIKQTELLKTVNQLSSNLKFAELEKKELADALNVYFENVQTLKSTLQRADIVIDKLLKENESLRKQLEERST